MGSARRVISQYSGRIISPIAPLSHRKVYPGGGLSPFGNRANFYSGAGGAANH